MPKFKEQNPKASDVLVQEDKLNNLILSHSIDENIRILQQALYNNQTIVYRRFSNQHSDKLDYCVIFVQGMADTKIINEDVIYPLMHSIKANNDLDLLTSKVLYLAGIKKISNVNEMIRSLLFGTAILLVDGADEALLVTANNWETRSIEEPPSEKVVRGPREGFSESLDVNISMVLRKIPSADLKLQFRECGTRTKTKICVCYIEDLVSEKVLKELNSRLDNIQIDGILESGYIEELISDSPMSPFRTIGTTERPDVIAGKLLEGRIAVLCDGTPVALTLPHLFVEYFQVNEDYYKIFIFSSINRLLRILGFFLSTSVPAIYVALTTFHQEMIPSPLLLTISAAREGLPFPTVVEALVMLLVFEIMREAGIRLPTPIGQAVSIVGALVLGEAAVAAKLISAPMVIITAITGITSFLIPQMIEVLIIIRFTFLILVSFFGFYGYIFGLIGILIHLMCLRSFGIPYMLNILSFNMQDSKDVYIRAPWWYMIYRPKLMTNNKIRKSKNN